MIFLAWCGAVQITRADTIDDLQQKINDRNAQIKQLETEIASYQKDLDSVGKEKESLQTAIKKLTLEDRKLTAEIKVTENRIESATLSLRELGANIGDKETKITANHLAIGNALRVLSVTESGSLIEFILNYKNLSDLWNEMQSIEQFQSHLKEETDTVKNMKQELETRQSEVARQKQNLLGLKNRVSDQQKLLQYNKQEKNNLLASTKNTEANYRKIIQQKFALRDAFEKELLDFESQLKFTIDPNSLPRTGSGVLRWPVSEVKITQYFGNTSFARANPQVYSGRGHNGIDLRAPIGTPITAALRGTVVGTGNTDTVCPGASYGKWILIEHPNGISTLYAHLSLIKVAEGQEIGTGDVLGYGGETGYATGPHLHFSVYATQGVKILEHKSKVCAGTYRMPIGSFNAYLNPLSYL